MESNMPQAIIHSFFDGPTNTVTYLVMDPQTKSAAVIDPVLDYDHASGRAAMESAALVLAKAAEIGAKVELVL